MNWSSVELAKIVEASSGTWGNPPKGDQNDTSVLRSTNIQDGRLVLEDVAKRSLSEKSINKYKLKDGDILVTTSSGSKHLIGKCTIFYIPYEGKNYVFSNFTQRLRPNESLVDPMYLYYYLLSSKAKSYLDRIHSTTSGLRNLNVNLYLNQHIPLPPISEQCRIVEILDQADSLRKKRAEADEKTTRILPALFYKMFGDPVTNPKGWPTEKLGDLFDVVGGGTPSKKIGRYWDGDIPWVSPKDMKSDVIFDTEDHITQEAIDKSATKLFPKGSILVVYRSGILVHSFPVATAGTNLTINQDLKALYAKSNDATNEYLYGWLKTAHSLIMSCVKKGATVHNVDGSRFLNLAIPKPPRSLQEKFGENLKSLLRQKDQRKSVAEQIDRLFSVVIHQAFDGQLTYKWRKSRMKELFVEMEEQKKALAIEG